MQLNNVTIQSSEANKLYFQTPLNKQNQFNSWNAKLILKNKNDINEILKMHCAGLEFRFIPKLISWVGLRIGLMSELPVLTQYCWCNIKNS